jgi:hypothetical protein
MKLEKQSESTKSSHALAAANIRKELKHNFPGQKFSVRSSSFAGGDSVRVSWVDGPTVDEVEAITAKYQYGHFNGMEDIYEYNGDHNGDFGSAKYVQSSRTVSDEHIIAACEECGVEYAVKENTYNGAEYVHIFNYDDERRVYRALNKSFYAAPVKGAAKGDAATPAKEKPADDAINATTETTGYKATSNHRECVCEAVAISESGDVATL